RDGRRLDLIHSTQHDRWILQDYRRLHEVGMHSARDGVRWHLIERTPGSYDWSSAIPMIRAAASTKTQVLWDLLHFGWPDWADPYSAEFVERFANFAAELTRILVAESNETPFISPINEISFLSFAGGEKGFFNPFSRNRGDELKRQFVRTCIAACLRIREVAPGARLIHTDPLINIVAHRHRPQDRLEAEAYRQSQFASWDMISGRLAPELGGNRSFLDVIGLNYYVQNQWIHRGSVLVPSREQFLPLRYMLREVSERYERPLFIAETGIEDDVRAPWLRYIANEARAARRLGAAVEGLCLYPIVNHPGWEDDRHCCNGLWDYANEAGERDIEPALAAELERQQQVLEEETAGGAFIDETLPREIFDRVGAELDLKTQQSRDAEL
ncbi:MAG TPA: hypothetical protein VFR10_09480, partial [bacterium]|nr:hypothetical protein [bacterium]